MACIVVIVVIVVILRKINHQLLTRVRKPRRSWKAVSQVPGLE